MAQLCESEELWAIFCLFACLFVFIYKFKTFQNNSLSNLIKRVTQAWIET